VIEPAIPNERRCFDLLTKYETPDHIVLHSRAVWEVGRVLGEGLLRRKHAVDMVLIRAACLLHDIGKFPCIRDGTKYHDVRGEEILASEGYPLVGSIVGRHVFLRSENHSPPREEHIVFYADKRVLHDEVVSLDDRFAYLIETYGSNPEAIRMLHLMRDDTLSVERALFGILDFEPDEIPWLLAPKP
jgi:uncharacterized protein